MISIKQKIQITFVFTLLVLLGVIAMTPKAEAAVDAAKACASVKANNTNYKKCLNYIKQYNTCKATDKVCKANKYKDYVKDVCGTGSTAVKCAEDQTKVIAARTTTSGAGVLECTSGGEVKNGCTCPAGEIVQTVDGVAKCVAASTVSNPTAQAPTTANTNPNLSKTPTIEGAPSESETYGYFEDPNCQGEGCLTNNPIVKWLNVIINVVAGVVGIGAVVMIIFAGVQYSTARDNAQVVQSAKEKIINVVIGLIAFGFLYTFLQWLVPGGVFS